MVVGFPGTTSPGGIVRAATRHLASPFFSPLSAAAPHLALHLLARTPPATPQPAAHTHAISPLLVPVLPPERGRRRPQRRGFFFSKTDLQAPEVYRWRPQATGWSGWYGGNGKERVKTSREHGREGHRQAGQARRVASFPRLKLFFFFASPPSPPSPLCQPRPGHLLGTNAPDQASGRQFHPQRTRHPTATGAYLRKKGEM